jgi:hypothetical protein
VALEKERLLTQAEEDQKCNKELKEKTGKLHRFNYDMALTYLL